MSLKAVGCSGAAWGGPLPIDGVHTWLWPNGSNRIVGCLETTNLGQKSKIVIRTNWSLMKFGPSETLNEYIPVQDVGPDLLGHFGSGHPSWENHLCF